MPNSKDKFLSKDDEAFISQLVSKKLVTVESLNESIQEKWSLQDRTPLFQFLLKKRAISLTEFAELKKEDMAPTRNQDARIDIKYIDNIPVVVHGTTKKIDKYEIIRELGRGGMGIVYQAQDTELGRTVALKTLKSGDDANEIELERFAREVRLAASLQHPNIIAVYETGICNNIHYFTMEYIAGIPVDEYVSKNKLNFNQIVAIIRDVANALALAHSKNIVHRDIKPGNILVDQNGVAHLGDFGLARNMSGDKSLTVSGSPIGTPAYMSPEQAAGKMVRVGKQSDVYALGAVLYELITGKPPFLGANLAQTISAILSQEIISPKKLVRGLPYDLETICLKCLEKDMKRRYPHARALAIDLDHYLNGEPIQARPPDIWYKSSKFILRNKMKFSFITVCLLFLLTAVYFFLLAPGLLTLSVTNAQLLTLSPEISVNGQKIADNRLNQFPLSYGYYKISLRLDGYESEEFIVEISPGKEVKIEKQMIAKRGKISVTSSLSQVEASFKNITTRDIHTFIIPTHEYQLPSGEYEATFKKENHFSERKKIVIVPDRSITINIALQAMLVWTRDVKQKEPLTSFTLGDTDLDGRLELLTASTIGTIVSYDFATHEKLWEIACNLTVGAPQCVLRDIDKDGFLDLLLIHPDAFRIMSGKNHKLLFNVPRYWGPSSILVDANKDGYEDLILVRSYTDLECYNLRDGSILWKNERRSDAGFLPILLNEKTMLHSSQSELYELNLSNGTARTIYSFFGKPARAKDPEDAKLLWISGKPILLWYQIEKGLRALDLSSLQELWQCDIKALNIGRGGLVLMDVDKDGTMEAVIHNDQLYCINTKNGKIIWKFDTQNKSFTSPPTIADLDGDEIPEIIAPSQNGKIYIVDARNGNYITEFVCKKAVQSLIPYDVNGDGILEILLLLEDEVYAIRYLPEKQIKVYEEDPQLIVLSEQFLDWNKDGHLDIVVGNRMGEIYCLDGRNWDKIWQHKVGKQIDNSPLITDINRDKRLEMIVQSKDIVTVFDDTFQKIWSFQTESQSGKVPLIADVNNDGEMEVIITTGANGLIQCLKGSNGKLLWQQTVYRMFMMPYLEDIDKDGRLDLVAISTMAFGSYGGIWCFNAKDGTIKWQTPIPCSEEAAYSQIVTYDANKDGVLEVFVPQINYLSCLDSRTGKPYWHRRLLGSDAGTFVIADINKDTKPEILIATLDHTLHCIDAKTGEVLWYENKLGKRNFAWEPSLIRRGPGIINLDADLDGDGIADFTMVNSRHLFCLFSGKDGRLLGTMNDVDAGDPLPCKVDIDGDQRLDWVFLNRKGKLVIIYDVLSRFEKLIKTPRYFDSVAQSQTVLWLYRFQHLLTQKNYKQLKKEISQFSSQLKDYPYWESLYRIISSMEQGTITESHIKELQKAGPNFVLNHFLRTVYFLEKNNAEEAKKQIKPIIKESVLLFHNLFQQYDYLIKNETLQRLQAILPEVIKETDCDIDIANAYKYATFTNKSWESDYFLELSLRYGIPGRADYETRTKNYIQKVLENSEGINSVYHQNHVMRMLNHAIEVLPDEVEIINTRADCLIRSNISVEEGMQEYQRSLKINPQQPELYLRLAQLWCERNNFPKALEHIDLALKFDTNETAIPYLFKIFIYMLLNDRPKITAEIEKVEKKLGKKMSQEELEFIAISKHILEGKKPLVMQKFERILPNLSQSNTNRHLQWLFYNLYNMISK